MHVNIVSVFSPHSIQAQRGLLPDKTHMKQSPHSARHHSTSVESPGYQTTAPEMTSINLLTNQYKVNQQMQYKIKNEKSIHHVS